MKNFHRFAGFLMVAAALALSIPSHAQQRVVNGPTVTQGQTVIYGGGTATPLDSLQVSDSIAYIIPINHTNQVSPFLTWQWNKIGSGTATITLQFLQNNDGGSTWFAVTKGSAQAAYTKSYTLSASGLNAVDFVADSAVVQGRYLKVYYITSATASVKGKLGGQLHAIIR